jgi:hypothetical protein
MDCAAVAASGAAAICVTTKKLICDKRERNDMLSLSETESDAERTQDTASTNYTDKCTAEKTLLKCSTASVR